MDTLSRYLAIGVVGAAALSSPAANAAIYDDGTFTISASASGAQLTSTVPGAYAVTSVSGGAISPGGSTNPGSGFPSNGGISSYIAAFGGNPVTFSLGGPSSYFGFLWGSLDSSNTITFSNNSSVVATYTGSQIANLGIGAQGYPSAASYVGFTADGAGSDFNTVTLSDNATYFETANQAAISAVPVPGALPMFGAALVGLVGLGARTSRRQISA